MAVPYRHAAAVACADIPADPQPGSKARDVVPRQQRNGPGTACLQRSPAHPARVTAFAACVRKRASVARGPDHGCGRVAGSPEHQRHPRDVRAPRVIISRACAVRVETQGLVTERDWQRVASDAMCDVLDRRLGVRASGDLGAAAGAPIAGSMLSAPPDLAVAGDPLSILPSWRGRGGLSTSRWNRPSSLAEYPPSGFPGGAERVPPWLISGSGHAGPRPAPAAGQRAQPDVLAVGSVAPNASPRPVRSTESRACAGTWSSNGRIASRAARISRPT